MTIRHVFLWKVAEGSDRQEVVDILSELSEKIRYIETWEVGRHEGEPNENGDPWHGALITDFSSWEDLDRYSNDPVHADVVARLLPMVSERAVVDWERA